MSSKKSIINFNTKKYGVVVCHAPINFAHHKDNDYNLFTTGLPFGSDMMAKMRANVAEQAVAKDGNNKPHQSGANITTGAKPKSKKVKMGKIKLRQAA